MNVRRKPPVGGREGGQMIVVFAVVLLVLLGFAALGIDVGYMYSVRNDLQRSVDSGALAGAFAFNDGGWVSGPVPAPLKAKAESRATFFATRDPVGPAPLTGGITFAYPGVNQIQVTAQYNANLFFAGIIGSPTVTLSATAVAEAIPVDQNVECLTPLAFPYPWTDGPPYNGRWDPGEPVGSLGSILQGLHVTFQVANTISPIPSYVINGLGGIGGAGEIFPTRMCGDSSGGESDLRLRIRTPCYDGCNAISIGDTVSLKDNPTYVPAIDEIQDELINNDPSGAWGGGPSNLPVSPDPAYSGDNWLLSPRVVRVMLYDPQNARATGTVRVTAFAGFWIESVSGSPSWPNNANVTGYFIPDSAVGGISSSPTLIEPSLKTTRLVQ